MHEVCAPYLSQFTRQLISEDDVLHVSGERNVVGPQCSHHSRNEVRKMFRRKPGSGSQAHELEIACWVVGFAEPDEHCKSALNRIYLGIIGRQRHHTQPMFLGNKLLDGGIMHGHLKADAVPVPDGVPDEWRAIGVRKLLTLVPLDGWHRIHLFSRKSLMKARACDLGTPGNYHRVPPPVNVDLRATAGGE